jgi:hypothetical protein
VLRAKPFPVAAVTARRRCFLRAATGSAAIDVAALAIYLLNRMHSRALDLEIAKDLAAYSILETASQGGKIGGPPANGDRTVSNPIPKLSPMRKLRN